MMQVTTQILNSQEPPPVHTITYHSNDVEETDSLSFHGNEWRGSGAVICDSRQKRLSVYRLEYASGWKGHCLSAGRFTAGCPDKCNPVCYMGGGWLL